MAQDPRTRKHKTLNHKSHSLNSNSKKELRSFMFFCTGAGGDDDPPTDGLGFKVGGQPGNQG